MTVLECRRFLPLVVDLAEGTIATTDRGPVEAHVAGCRECQETLESLRELPGALGEPEGLPAPDETFWRAQRHDVMRSVRLVDGVIAGERRTAWRRAGLAAIAAGLLAATGVRWGMTPPPPAAIATAILEPMRLARLEIIETFAGTDGLLAPGDLDVQDPLDDADLEALEDFLGTA